jgi:hypothetical protein
MTRRGITKSCKQYLSTTVIEGGYQKRTRNRERERESTGLRAEEVKDKDSQ